MKVSIDLVKKVREITAASISDCRESLQEAKGDIDKAVELLRKRGLEIAAKKSERIAQEGRIEAYVHLGNKIGVLLEVNCETDFVARNEDFCRFTKDLALQIVATNPLYINKEDVPKKELKGFKSKKEDYYKDNCLLEQIFIKDPTILSKTI